MMIPRKDLDIFDSFFNDPFFERKSTNINSVMKTDIKEKDGNYVLDIDMPGYEKQDIKISLENNYVTVTASKNESQEDSKDGEYIYKERYIGQCSRSYYVGKNVREEDIKASFKNGTLTLIVPNKNQEKVEEKKFIQID